MEKYIDEMIKEANKAKKSKEVPVGAIIVYKNKIIARGHNKRLKSNDVINHAEIIAIRKAARKIKDWRLNDCDLYVTLEPCNMCKEIIKESRINNVYFLTKKNEEKKSYNKTNIRSVNEEKFSTKIEEYRTMLTEFFKLNCNRK